MNGVRQAIDVSRVNFLFENFDWSDTRKSALHSLFTRVRTKTLSRRPNFIVKDFVAKITLSINKISIKSDQIFVEQRFSVSKKF